MNSDKMRENADAATELLKALASRNRLLILCQLIGGERSVGDGQTIYYSLQGKAAGRVLETLYDIYCSP